MKIRSAFAGLALALSTFVWTSSAAFAQAGNHDHDHMSSDQPLTPAEVRAVDLKTGKLTLKHDELKNLGMPGMTMSFPLRKGLALPADLKAGDKVQVRVEDLGGTLTVTQLNR